MNRPNAEVIRTEGSSPFFDNMSFIKNNIDEIINKFFRAPEVLEMGVIVEELQAYNNHSVSAMSKILSLATSHYC